MGWYLIGCGWLLIALSFYVGDIRHQYESARDMSLVGSVLSFLGGVAFLV